MENLKAAEIAQTGEKLVEEWLSENGFINVRINTDQDGSNAIEANGSIENILVHIRTAIQPARPGIISDDERARIKGTAESQGHKAYVAYVIIDADKNVVGEISWERLS